MRTTQYLKVNARQPEQEIIHIVAQYIKSGELVAFPTETVYGLGADVFNPLAVEKIFQAKGRPPENALLVHVSSLLQVDGLVKEISPTAQKLMEHFWPGPLSIILPSQSRVPEIVRGGQVGVGLRMPSHPVALALIEATGPLAAPSANLYGRPSPTNAGHVKQDLDGSIAAVLDAGETGSGLESTLLDLSSGSCRILRSGAIRVDVLEEYMGQKIDIVQAESLPQYIMKCQVIISENEEDLKHKLDTLNAQGMKTGTVHIAGMPRHKIERESIVYDLDLSGQGVSLYSILRDAEENGVEILVFAPLDPELARLAPAMMDRINRAASRE